MTQEEQDLLDKLSSGQLDGVVGDFLTTSGGSDVWKQIKDGVPTQFKKGPGSKYFNGEENESVDGVLHVMEEWSSDSEKLEFLRKFGWLMDDSDVREYSAKYK